MDEQYWHLPLLPLRNIIVFPSTIMNLDVGRDKSFKALEEAMMKDQKLCLVTQIDGNIEDPSTDDLYRVGVSVEVKQVLKLPGGTIRILVEGQNRVRINKFITTEPFYKVEVEEVEAQAVSDSESIAMQRTLMSLFERYVKTAGKVPPEVLGTVVEIDEPGRLVDIIVTHISSMRIEGKQQILEASDVITRIEILTAFMSHELEIAELEKKISNRVRKQMEKSQKEYYLREQMKAIQKELGDRDEKLAELEEYNEKIKNAKMPKEVLEKVKREVTKLEKMPPMAAEAVVVRNYLDALIALPWKQKTKDNIDLVEAKRVLDKDHYGLEKVKERILEHLAVKKLSKDVKGPILCLVGPPGVGKTSLARSIAKTMGRKFVRVSLGGIRDEAEIRGHRRTYIGAMPGRIMQGMKTAGSVNPVFLLDEIDKMSMDFRGDPSAALLEVLDPEQNSAYSDHYIELPYDLSQVMFITTANAQHNIPHPLLDRMELIYLGGYTEIEKLKIAQKYLLPRKIQEHGLKPEQLELSEKTLLQLIRYYTREAGVRSLDRQLAGLCRKTAKEIVLNGKSSVRITAANLEKLIGPRLYHYGVASERSEIGVSTGLAWTEAGGDILPIEVTVVSGTGKLILTGQLGDVMQESAQAGVSFIRSRADKLGIEEGYFEKHDIHIHVPEGGIPKDGPSAGVAMATALTSALTRRPVKNTVAMTGEITLRGRVLPIGGLKEKLMAAHRAGITTVILPEENRRNIEELPESVMKKLTVHFVSVFDEVVEIALDKLDVSVNEVHKGENQ